MSITALPRNSRLECLAHQPGNATNDDGHNDDRPEHGQRQFVATGRGDAQAHYPANATMALSEAPGKSP